MRPLASDRVRTRLENMSETAVISRSNRTPSDNAGRYERPVTPEAAGSSPVHPAEIVKFFVQFHDLRRIAPGGRDEASEIILDFVSPRLQRINFVLTAARNVLKIMDLRHRC
jgi:hypothetical protein